mgnify:CR=1 FL=1
MNLQNWINQADRHWKAHQPQRYKSLKKQGSLQLALKQAAQQTLVEVDQLERNGLSPHEAWEMVREKYLFPSVESQSQPQTPPGANLSSELTLATQDVAERSSLQNVVSDPMQGAARPQKTEAAPTE